MFPWSIQVLHHTVLHWATRLITHSLQTVDTVCMLSLVPFLDHSRSFHLFVFRFEHPRFGLIKCIKTIYSVRQHEELTVAYEYDHQGVGGNAPEWYK